MIMSLELIANLIGAKPTANTGAISGWSIDSRTIAPGDCFFALRGPTHDGHDYVASVFERGAALAIVEKADHEIPTAGPQLIVDDTTRALQSLGHGARQLWNSAVIGVTGSAGKTTT